MATIVACAAAPRDEERSHNRSDLAKDLLGRAEDAAAEVEAKKAIALDPRNEEAYNVLGLVYLYRGNRTDRLLEVDDCLDGTIGESLRSEVSEHMRLAEAQFAKAVEIAPDFGEAWQNRAVVALYFEDYQRAIAFEQKALAGLARLQSEPLARANLGWAYFKLEDHARAASELLQATHREPGFCLGNYRLGMVLFEKGEYAPIVERLVPFLADPGSCPVQEVYLLTGQALLKLDDRETAVRAFDTCVQLAPRSCQARLCGKALEEIADLTPQAERVK